MLNTTYSNEDGELIVKLEGRLDALTAPGFDRELESKLPGTTGLTIDFEKLEYISSGGLRTILAAQQFMMENGLKTVTVKNVSEDIRDVFSVTGFMKVVNVI